VAEVWRWDLLHLVHGEDMGEFVKVTLGQRSCDGTYWDLVLWIRFSWLVAILYLALNSLLLHTFLHVSTVRSSGSSPT